MASLLPILVQTFFLQYILYKVINNFLKTNKLSPFDIVFISRCYLCDLKWYMHAYANKLVILRYTQYLRVWQNLSISKQYMPWNIVTKYPPDSTLLALFMLKLLTCWLVWKIIKDAFTFSIISWILFNKRRTKFTTEQPYTLPILHCQYHVCWCPGDLRKQSTAGMIFTKKSRNILSLASEEWTVLRV